MDHLFPKRGVLAVLYARKRKCVENIHESEARGDLTKVRELQLQMRMIV
jgi:hypothetical protein